MHREEKKETWTQKYRPKSLEDIVGHTTTIKKIREWAQSWKEGRPKKPLLLHGPPGAGKTTIVETLRKEYGWEILEVNASDTRNKENIEKILGSAATSRTLAGKKRLILIDEVDGLFRQDHGGTRAINRIIKESTNPMVLTANNAYEQKIKTIRTKCTAIELRKVHPSTISKVLAEIAEKEGVKAEKEALKELGKNSNGDVRAAINDFQALAQGKEELKKQDLGIMNNRNVEESIFNAVKQILKKKSFEESRESLKNLNENPDFTLKWIDENLPRQYKDKEDLHRGMKTLSKADSYLGRARKGRNYGLWRYASIMMGPGVSLSKKEEYRGYVRYGFPSIIKKLGSTKKERNTRKMIGSKVGKKCHVSTKAAVINYIPLLTQLIKKEEEAINLTAYFGFNQEELTFLGAEKPEEVTEKAEKLITEQVSQGKKKKTPQKNLNHF